MNPPPPTSTSSGGSKPITGKVPFLLDLIEPLAKDFDLSSEQGSGLFTEAAASALHTADANFGHIRKHPGQNQFNGHAVDAVLYKLGNGEAVAIDIIFQNGVPGARPQWLLVAQGPDTDWYAP